MIPLLAGMVGGAALGGYGAYEGNKNTRKKNNAIQSNATAMQGDIRGMEEGRVRGLREQYAPLVGNDFAGDTQAYYDALENADYSQFDLAAPEDFAFDQAAETQRQLNPELQAIIDRSTGEVTNSAANAGKLFSGAAGKGIARATADIQAKEWDAASQRAQTERTNKYQQWTDKFKTPRPSLRTTAATWNLDSRTRAPSLASSPRHTANRSEHSRVFRMRQIPLSYRASNKVTTPARQTKASAPTSWQVLAEPLAVPEACTVCLAVPAGRNNYARISCELQPTALSGTRSNGHRSPVG